MSLNYEIERKFLIKMPDILKMQQNKDCEMVYIKQTYLKDKTRIRSLTTGDNTVYIKTVKHKVTDITRIENENEITKEEYLKLLDLADTERQTLTKTRYKYPYMGKVFEIDVFPFWKDRAFLEIELEREDEEFTIPPFIEVIKEVTHLKEYRNFALAKEIPNENF